jgi:hypothetical protein
MPESFHSDEHRGVTTATRQLDWLPITNTRVQAVRCGHVWDAVCVPASCGEVVLRLLGDRSGALIEDLWARLMYWLVRPGTADAWPDWPEVQLLGEACWLTVPGLLCDGSLHWRIRPDRVEDHLTDPDLLRQAVASWEGAS